ncbi:protein-glutamate O-methyltransferase CheR [Pseudooceanicola sp. CBS1P-1]|uniref:protein-glutamate O-methyltransferase n=1 Tax=Pseudooceanicola albus TaxID=2692189 RepID=A0A6L7G9M3_9RHOB|nr:MULTISPECIES: protein-glutamate O-methyltransferase CheR [Pseudooceanicola]MBT9382848.1 protein-glutamate O-methyltransferase CheR [Pseudooceanicola endophyticus]MXN20228.1 chemotaxis protein [Pseudooceanicola albus]
MSVTALSAEDFGLFREYFYKKTGIEFDESKRYFVDKRILKRIEATGAPSFRDYFVKMRFEASQKEFQNIVNLMTVNETYFFREEHQFRCLTGPVLDEVVEIRRRRKGPIRILSLPCSTGEEPYSIALSLIADWPGLAQHDVELAGCDIDTEVLARARDGLYGARSVQHVPPAVLAQHFTAETGNRFRISEELRGAVDLFRMNLSNPEEARSLRNYDVIFCRNMLIYFDDTSRRMATDALYDALNPGGFLFLGHSESMSRISSLFTIRKFPQAIVYQRGLS